MTHILFEWKDKVQETVGQENSNIVVVRKKCFHVSS